MDFGSWRGKRWAILLTCLISIHFLKIFVLVTIRNWIWKMVNITKNIWRKQRGLADTTVNVITLLYTKHIVADFTVTLHEHLQLFLSFCQHFVVSVGSRELSIFLISSHKLCISPYDFGCSNASSMSSSILERLLASSQICFIFLHFWSWSSCSFCSCNAYTLKSQI